MALVVKSTLDPQTLVAPVRAAVQAIDPGQPIADVRTMDQWIGRSLQTRRAPTLLPSIFGGVALLLAAIGIYGRSRSAWSSACARWGSGSALGADRRAIMDAGLAGQGVRMAAIGVVLGLAGALGLSRYLKLLFEVGTRDVSVFAGARCCCSRFRWAGRTSPARRIDRIDPIAALREGRAPGSDTRSTEILRHSPFRGRSARARSVPPQVRRLVKLTNLRRILQYIPQIPRRHVFMLAIDGAIVTDDNFATLMLDVALLAR